MTTGPRIRLAHAEDLPALREIEREAGEPFRALGMSAIADDEPPSLATLSGYQRDGRAWVCTDGHPVAYLIADVVDGNAHIEQVSVRPSHARRGIGRDLIDTLAAWAAARGLAGLTLTTFAEVPWNAPYYRRLGFRPVPGNALSDGLREILRHEAEAGLDAWPRVVLQRPL